MTSRAKLPNWLVLLAALTILQFAAPAFAQQRKRAAPPPAATTETAEQKEEGKKPNILVIMGDDVGWFNIGAYHRGIMSGKTPSLDKLASEGMMFTDYYAEASCTAGAQTSLPASCRSAPD